MESLNAAKIIEECKMSGEAVAEIVASHGEDQFIHVSDIEEFATNHDRLVEGVKDLLEIVKRLVGNGVDLLNIEDVEDEEDAASIHAKFNDVINEAGSLLAKHK